MPSQLCESKGSVCVCKETRLLLTLARGACVGQGGDQEEANLEMLNVQKG